MCTSAEKIIGKLKKDFENCNFDFFLKEKIIPMAWSTLAGGSFINPKSEIELRVSNTLKEVAKELNIDSIDKIIYSWLLKHPASIIPVIGTGKIERIKNIIFNSPFKNSCELLQKKEKSITKVLDK